MPEPGELRRWIASERMPWRQDGSLFMVMGLNVVPCGRLAPSIRGWILLESGELSFETEEIMLAHSEVLSSNT